MDRYDARQSVALFVPALIALAALAWAGTIMVDGDTYLHIAAGEWIIQHRQFIYTDPFTYTFYGSKWDAPEWLAELAMALAFRAIAWSGVALLYALAFASTAFLLARRLLRSLDPLPAVIILQLALLCMANGLSSRPYVLALPILAAWTTGLLSARDNDRTPSPWLLVLMALWSNIHGSFIFGIALVVPFAAEAVWFEKGDRFRVARAWALFGLGSIAAAAINPHGAWGLVDPILFMSKPVLAYLLDWQSSLFSRIGPLEVSILGLIAFAIVRPMRMPLFRLLLLLLLLHMALSHRRHTNIFAVVAPMLLAEPISLALSRRVETQNPRPGSLAAPATALALASGIVVVALRLAFPNERINDAVSPSVALSHVPARIAATHVLNSDVVGGFLIWHKIRPFIDTRAELFSDSFLDNYGKMFEPNREVIVRTLARYRIGWTMLSPTNSVNIVLDTLPGWRLLYKDKYSSIHVRVDAAPTKDQ